jgi:LPXTG-motif cell wall-anchored protein
VYHWSQGGSGLVEKSIAFAADAAGKTGAYISLSCYYHGVAAGTPVPELAGIGTFTVTGVPGCFNDAHIVASHPALEGLTDGILSNWGCSVHEAFDSWPSSFSVLAIALSGDAFEAADGSVGTPYILARGEGLSASNIQLSPVSATLAVGETHTLTATILSGGEPLPDQVVTFTATAGPNAGLTLTGTTGADGKTAATYSSSAPGTDTWTASYTDNEITQTSNEVTVTWEGTPVSVAETTTTAAPVTTAATPTTVAAQATLPRTGGDTSTGLLWLGMVLVATGGALAGTRRRLRRDPLA